MLKKVIFVVLLSFRLQAYCTSCYSEYWQQFFWKTFEKDALSLRTFIRIDSKNHARNIRSFQINEQLAWKLSNRWNLQIHYAYVHGRDIVSHSSWIYQNRLELEINRTFFALNGCMIDTRNRLEIRRLQGEPKTNYRLRQRTTFMVPFDNRGALKFFSADNEIFYDINNHYFTQDRLCPVKLTFELSKETSVDVFFMFRFFHHDTMWHKDAVFGTQLNF